MIRTSPLTVKQLKEKYQGIGRVSLSHIVYNQFSVNPYYKCALKFYRLTYMSGEQFKSFLTPDGQLRTNMPCLGNLRFNIIYQNCTPYHVKRAPKLVLSYRIAEDDFNIEPIVLVRIATTEEPLL